MSQYHIPELSEKENLALDDIRVHFQALWRELNAYRPSTKNVWLRLSLEICDQIVNDCGYLRTEDAAMETFFHIQYLRVNLQAAPKDLRDLWLLEIEHCQKIIDGLDVR